MSIRSDYHNLRKPTGPLHPFTDDFGNGATVLLEQPTYHRMNQPVNRQNLAYETINRGFDGLDFWPLERVLQI